MQIDTSKPIILTASDIWVDIDSYACILAYKYLLDLLNIESQAVIRGDLNESITKSVRNLNLNYNTKFDGEPDKYNYILLDISEKDFFAKFVVLENILKVYDHRSGFKDYWKEKLGDNAVIEMVGSCATLVWEEFKKENLQDEIKQGIARVLAYAIFSNTLALKSKNTTNRDYEALEELLKSAKFEDNWQREYYNELNKSITANPEKGLRNDTKQIDLKGTKCTITQLELWNSREFVGKYESLILEILKSFGNQLYFFTSPSISEGKNYIVTDNAETQKLLGKALDAKFRGNIGTTDQLYLRKEIIRIINS